MHRYVDPRPERQPIPEDAAVPLTLTRLVAEAHKRGLPSALARSCSSSDVRAAIWLIPHTVTCCLKTVNHDLIIVVDLLVDQEVLHKGPLVAGELDDLPHLLVLGDGPVT